MKLNENPIEVELESNSGFYFKLLPDVVKMVLRFCKLIQYYFRNESLKVWGLMIVVSNTQL